MAADARRCAPTDTKSNVQLQRALMWEAGCRRKERKIIRVSLAGSGGLTIDARRTLDRGDDLEVQIVD